MGGLLIPSLTTLCQEDAITEVAVPDAALFALDDPRPLTRGGWVAWGVGASLLVLGTAWVLDQSERMLQPLVWVPVTHALVVAIVCGFTAALLLGQASTSGQRAYQWLGATYLFLAGLLLGFPLFFPGVTGGVQPLLGGDQSSVNLYYLWHLMFVGGLLASMVILWSDQRRRRRPGLRYPVRLTVAVVVFAVVITELMVSWGQAFLPRLIGSPSAVKGDLASALDVITLMVAVGATLFAAYAAWGGSMMQRWLLALSLLALAEAVVSQRSTARWSVAWYYERVFAMVALTALFAALVLILARIGRATSRLALSDPLTGCESRAAFTASLERELAAAHRTGTGRALLWIDIDGFKSVNDQVGHPIGDEVLRVVVARICDRIRPVDHVGRLGGDEFGVLLSDPVSSDRTALTAERLLSGLREPIVIDDTTTLLSASIGIASFPDQADTSLELLSRSDLAMYAAKNAGGDRYTTFSPEVGSLAWNNAALRYQLAAAIRGSEFVLDVQPIVALGDAAGRQGEVVGMEVLVRWQTLTERVSAGRFIDFATASGQIIQIGRQVVTLIEAHIDRLLAVLPPDGFVALNLSVKELTDTEIVQRLLVGPLGRRSRQLILEVTESAELVPGSEAETNLEQLRLRGYSVAVDDFGAGFSSFQRLEQLHPLLLKADRSLIVRASDQFQADGTAFLQAAVSVARSLGCGVVAEGVETEDQLVIARELGVDFAQGYLLGRPTPVERWSPPSESVVVRPSSTDRQLRVD